MRSIPAVALVVATFVVPSRPSNATEGAEPALSPPASSNALGCPPKPWDTHQTTIGVNLGLFSAVGLLGVTGSFSPASFLESEIGVGYGFSGYQLSAMQKLTVEISATLRFVTGAGLSFGTGSRLFPDPSLWLNLDLLGIEVRAASGFVFFLSSGITTGVAGGKFSYDLHEDCGNPPSCSFRHNVPGAVSPQMRLGFAFWF